MGELMPYELHLQANTELVTVACTCYIVISQAARCSALLKLWVGEELYKGGALALTRLHLWVTDGRWL